MSTSVQLTVDGKSQIEKVLTALTESWNRHDMAAFGALFAEDADFVNVLGMHWHGRPEIEARHADVHRTIFRHSKLRTLEHSLRPLGPGVVLAHVRWEMTGHESLPGIPFAEVRQGMITGVLVEQEGRWRIAAFHNTDIVPLPGSTK